MKTIRIKFINFWSDFDCYDNFITNILKTNYNVEISDNPDYVITTPGGSKFEYAKYDAVRILLSGEPFSADYNSFDYIIDFDDYIFDDRHLRYPIYLYSRGLTKGPYIPRKTLSREEAIKKLKDKNSFCNFIYGHKTVTCEREKLLDKINEYKKVDSVGKYLNSTGNTVLISNSDEKIKFLNNCKFTIASESMSKKGFTTEKLTDAFCSYSIPIYFGNPDIYNEFNKEAFINVSDYKNLDEMIKVIKEIDNNDELYINMLMQNEFVDNEYCLKKYDELCKFLFNIFDQPIDKAYRRNRLYICNDYNRIYILINKLLKFRLLNKIGLAFAKLTNRK